MISSQTKDTQVLQEQWLSVPLKKSLKDGGPIYQASFGDYMICYVQNSDRTFDLFALDLRDNSIQEAKFNGGSLLLSHVGFTFTKYKDDQIVKYGLQLQRSSGKIWTKALMERITIESFKPFSVKCEEINMNGDIPILAHPTSQIYNDCLYVLGGNNQREGSDPEENLWCFDLKTLTWKSCQASGEKPGLLLRASSHLIQDNLYIYGGKYDTLENKYQKDIFVLNLSKMSWTKIEQKDTFLNQELAKKDPKQLEGAFYKDHLIILETVHSEPSQNKLLFCWNLRIVSLAFDSHFQ